MTRASWAVRGAVCWRRTGECFEKAAELALKVNFNLMDREIKKAVVYLDPHEFHSTWLGNKSVYRTRMALADGAELIVLAPAVHEFWRG